MSLPLLLAREPDATFAVYRERRVTVGEFLRDVGALAARLPERAHVLNDCADRYRFMTGLAAAMVRGQVSLLPGNRAPLAWSQLGEQHPSIYCLTDQAEVPPVMEVFRCEPEGASPSGTAPAVPSFPVERLIGIAFTSGSTAAPKPVRKYWGALVREAQAGGRCLGLGAHGGRGGIVATVPPHHMYGFIASVMLPLQLGYPVYAGLPFFPEDVRLALEASPGPGVLVTTPAQLRACVLERPRLPALRFILSSAAPLPRALAEEAEGLFRAPVLEYYGSTETGAIACRRQTESEVWRTFDGVRVAPLEGGFRVEADYFPEPVILSDLIEALSPREFRLLGRDTDIVKIAGKRASLMHLNQQLQELDGVVDGAFLLLESSDGREPRLTAFAVAPGKTREDLLAALRVRVDEVFLPRPLRLVERLPRTVTGKLPRAGLLALLQEEEEKEPSGTGGG